MKDSLQNYKKIITSQWGEDGILNEIFNRIGTTNKICIEFGAGDGTYSSNVWNLIKNLQWNGLLMEPDKDRFAKWKKIMEQLENLKVLNIYVNVEGENSLENILKRNDVPVKPDLLSIDIDGDDYYIFEGLKEYKPRVIIIEHNPTIPADLEVVQSIGEVDSYGSSAKANVLLAEKKGYVLVAATHTNCIFVSSEEFGKLEMEKPRLEDIFDRSGLTHLITSYYGGMFLRNESRNPSFAYFYNSLNLRMTKKSRHVLTVGFSVNKKYAQKIPENFIPVKILKYENDSNRGLFGTLFSLVKKIPHFLKKF